jgi:spore maturation protein CgeB
MKILYAACKYDYGNPELGLSFEHYNLYESLVAMDGGRHEVIYFPFDAIDKETGSQAMNKRLVELALAEKPDLCLFFLFGDYIKKDTVKKITAAGVKTFNWFADDKWRFENFSKHWGPLFSLISTDQPSRVQDYRRIGYENVVVCCWGCNHRMYKPLDVPKIYDVSFVGQPHGNRRKIIEKIRKAGIKVECFGRGWPNGKVSQEEMIKIFCQSKINLNPTKCSGMVDAKSIARIFLDTRPNQPMRLNTPVQWVENAKSLIDRQKNEIKGRNFEVPGCGSFLLSGYAQDLEYFYEIGKEIDCYYDDRDLIKKIRYYLDRDQEREAVAKAGYKRTMKDHTYEQRFRTIFEAMGLS